MARTNLKTKSEPVFTHEGAVADKTSAEMQLRRSVLSCLLFENEFYEDGVEISERIASLIPKVNPLIVANLAINAREQQKLRHMPLFIVREMARIASHKSLVADTLSTIIQRADELAEFLALYWKDKKQPISAQVKKGLAQAFLKFDEYQLAKYNRDNDIKLRDVLFLVHAKPANKAQEKLWKRLIDGKLAIPDTWEVGISNTHTAEEKYDEWSRLLKENKLSSLALLRNLRNMYQAGITKATIQKSLSKMKTERVLPFRFISAARAVPAWEDLLEEPMLSCLSSHEKMDGHTALLIDVSGSMGAKISGKSEISRMDAAAALAILLREVCKSVTIYTFSDKSVVVPSRRGFALRDAVINSQRHSSTDGTSCVLQANKEGYDRIIILTDEQWMDSAPKPKSEKAYFINVASNKHGISYKQYQHIDGWSESVIDWIRAYESDREDSNQQTTSRNKRKAR